MIFYQVSWYEVICLTSRLILKFLCIFWVTCVTRRLMLNFSHHFKVFKHHRQYYDFSSSELIWGYILDIKVDFWNSYAYFGLHEWQEGWWWIFWVPWDCLSCINVVFTFIKYKEYVCVAYKFRLWVYRIEVLWVISRMFL